VVSAVRKILPLFILLVVLLASFVAADDFSVTFAPGQQTIANDELALYNITILQDYAGVEFFEVYSPDVLWDIRTKGALHVQPKQTFVTTLTIQPLNINPGLYGVPIHVKRTGTNQVKKALLYMEVTGTPSATTYLPAIRGTVSIQGAIDPREEIPITVYFENQNRRNLTDVDVKVRSNVINQDFKASVGPLERKSITFLARIDPNTPPQEDTLKVSLIASEGDKGFQFDLPPVDYTIRSYGQIVPTIEVTQSFLKTTRIITLTNVANTVIQEPYAFALPWYARIFTWSTPKSRSENGALVWDAALNVGNTMQLRVVTNYVPLFVGIIVVIFALILYYLFRSPLVIRKSATVYRTREGGISELKVLLEIKNRSGKPIHHAGVVDLVPRIADLLHDHEVGTLAPEKVVKHERKGTIIKYTVGDILPYEERVISYRIKSTLSILGGVSLPEAVSKFTTSKGRERTTTSNRPRVRFLG
jgi:hypothetical protein